MSVSVSVSLGFRGALFRLGLGCSAPLLRVAPERVTDPLRDVLRHRSRPAAASKAPLFDVLRVTAGRVAGVRCS